MKNTPSERTHFKLDPFSTFGTSHSKEHPLLIFLKNIVGSGIPLLLALYIISCMVNATITMFLGYLIALLTFIYIVLDHFGKKQEIPLFCIGGDLWLFTLLITVALGLLINAPDIHFWKYFSKMHWILLLYSFTYAFYLFPGIKRFFHIILTMSVITCLYAIIQHFSGIDVLHKLGLQPNIQLGPPSRVNNYLIFPTEGYYQIIGFFQNHFNYGFFFSMILCFPIAGIFLLNNKGLGYQLFLIITSSLISLSLLWTYNKGIWISTVTSLLFMSGFVSRKLLIKTALSILLIFGTFYYFDSNFQKQDIVLDTHHHNQETKIDIWKANFAMFLDHPWIGIGLEQNEVHIRRYYQKLNIDNWEVDHAHNTYISWLATTGSLGLVSYILFILTFLLMTARMWMEIPSSNLWHRTFILALLGVQISMHVGGLTHWHINEVQHFFVFALAIVAYIYKKYNEAVVFDDHCL